MKKISTKKPTLALNKETLRSLTKGELGHVNGGAATVLSAVDNDPCNWGPPRRI